MFGGIPAVGLMLGTSLHCFAGFTTVLVPLFGSISLVSALLRRGLAPVFLLVNVSVMLVGITFLTSMVMLVVLRGGKRRCTQHQSKC
jgi:hypothetical protein